MTQELIAEIDKTIALIKSKLPGSLENERNQKLERQLERDMAKYFHALNDAIPFSDLESLYYKHVKQE